MSLSRKPRPTRPALRREDEALADELARQNADELQRLRAHARLELRLDLVVRPGNLSAGREPVARGRTLDVSPGGCRARLDAAPTPGDLYSIELSGGDTRLPRVHAQCMRCALVGDDEFEVGFRFLSTLDHSTLRADDGAEELLD
jgi:hypothetical protein